MKAKNDRLQLPRGDNFLLLEEKKILAPILDILVSTGNDLSYLYPQYALKIIMY